MRFGLLVSFAWLAGVALAQRTDAMFDQNCASCHEVGSTANSAKAPDRKAISKLTTEAILRLLDDGFDEGPSAESYGSSETQTRRIFGRIAQVGSSGSGR